MKAFILITIAGLGTLGLLFKNQVNSERSVTFQSLESITESGSPVFNEIKFILGWEKDIWLMRQSHHGSSLDPKQWDKLAIVVDKTKSPTIASFYQLAEGDLSFNSQNEIQPLKARCFACHSNGPRAVRMNINSDLIQPSFSERITVALWNLRIKTYGKVKSVEGVHFDKGVSFKSKLPILSRPLALKSCTKCHGDNGIRNALSLEQIGTANFLVKNRLMPPFPFAISNEDSQVLKNLIQEP